MTARLLEFVFRHKVLLLVPILAGTALGAFWILRTPPKHVYLAQASVWIDRPSEITGMKAVDFNPYTSPALNQTAVLQELLSSKSFVTSVLGELGEVNPTSGRIKVIRTKTAIWPAGSHLIYVQHKSSDPQAATSTVKAVLDQFTVYFNKQITDKAGQTSDYYQAQLTVARKTFDDANNELQSYIQAHPRVVLPVPVTSGPTAPPDPTYVKLSLRRDSAKDTYDKILSDYGQSQVVLSTADGNSPYFSIVDKPELPDQPLPMAKKPLLVKLAAGTIAGLVLSGLLFAVLWKADRKLRVADDLDYLGIDIVGLPALKLSQRRRKWPKAYIRIASALQAGLLGTHRRSGTAA